MSAMCMCDDCCETRAMARQWGARGLRRPRRARERWFAAGVLVALLSAHLCSALTPAPERQGTSPRTAADVAREAIGNAARANKEARRACVLHGVSKEHDLKVLQACNIVLRTGEAPSDEPLNPPVSLVLPPVSL